LKQVPKDEPENDGSAPETGESKQETPEE